MFDYPLVLSQDTLYAKLGIGPEAGPGDILDAKDEIVALLNQKKQRLQRRYHKALAAVPGLEACKNKLVDRRKDSAAVQDSEYERLLSNVARLERDAQKIDPDFKKLEAEIDKAESEVTRINAIKLENPEERRKYDLATPPCALLKLAEFAAPIVKDGGAILFNVRGALTLFLEIEKNTPCYHPSDLTRRIFTSDFEPCALLDEED